MGQNEARMSTPFLSLKFQHTEVSMPETQSHIVVNFTDPIGATYQVDAVVGESLMWSAKQVGIPGIDAECGGSAACGTCVVEIGALWREHLPPIGNDERDMLDFISSHDSGKRLSCQLKVHPGMAGMEVVVSQI
jgi:ferredoxin, 2Fe-2S